MPVTTAPAVITESSDDMIPDQLDETPSEDIDFDTMESDDLSQDDSQDDNETSEIMFDDDEPLGMDESTEDSGEIANDDFSWDDLDDE